MALVAMLNATFLPVMTMMVWMMTNDLIESMMVVITLRYDDDYYGTVRMVTINTTMPKRWLGKWNKGSKDYNSDRNDSHNDYQR